MLKKKVTEEELFEKVNDQSIFNHYFGAFEMGKAYPSIFRQDENPSTGFFENGEGRIVYHDFATDEKLGSIKFVAKLYGINYFHAMNKIAQDFGITASKEERELAKIMVQKPQPKKEKKYHVVLGEHDERELDYWRQFSIRRDELKENFVYPCRELKINYYLIENPNNYLRFVYVVHDTDGQEYVKIYSPHDPKFKWCGNVKNHMPFGLMELPYKSDTLIITKGQKDRLIWKKYFSDVIATQNESKESLKDSVVELINSKYKEVYINFDCDETGIRSSKYLTETYGWKHINVPNVYYEKAGIKDFADLVKERGLKTFENYIKWKGLLKQ